jgi:hypothetical protein
MPAQEVPAMQPVDWSAEANRAAGFAGDATAPRKPMIAVFRGAMPWRIEGVTLIFGNDGYERDQRSKDEVAKVRRFLAENGIEELGFATSPEGYSWAMLVRSDDDDRLNDVVWAAWPDADETQKGFALSVMAEHRPKEKVSWD